MDVGLDSEVGELGLDFVAVQGWGYGDYVLVEYVAVFPLWDLGFYDCGVCDVGVVDLCFLDSLVVFGLCVWEFYS